MEASNELGGQTTRPTSAMQVGSSDEVFLAPGRNNDGIGVLERPSSLPPVATAPVSGVTSSSDEASVGGTQKDSATPMPTSMNDLPSQ